MPGTPPPPLFHAFAPKRDHDLWRRRVIAWALTLLWMVTVTASWGLNALLHPFDRLVVKPPQDEMVVIEVKEAKVEEQLPAPPPPRAYAPTPTVEKTPPKPDEPAEVVKKLTDDVKQQVTAEIISGTPDGVVGGSESAGTGTGVLGGTGSGDIVHTFAYTEVVVTKRVQPDYPDDAKKMFRGQADPSCKVRVFIDTAGVPYDVKFEACPEVFHQSAHDAVMQWRWAPAQFGGRSVKAQFTITIKYKMS